MQVGPIMFRSWHANRSTRRLERQERDLPSATCIGCPHTKPTGQHNQFMRSKLLWMKSLD